MPSQTRQNIDFWKCHYEYLYTMLGSKPKFLGQGWPCVAFICSLVGAQASRPGPYDTKETTFVVPSLDSTNQVVDCFYPVGNNTMNSSFRLLSYTHGFGGGGIVEPVGYFSLFRDIASFGYVVGINKYGMII
jgi:hypothetical protein